VKGERSMAWWKVEYIAEVLRAVTLALFAWGALMKAWIDDLKGWDHVFLFWVLIVLLFLMVALEMVRINRTHAERQRKAKSN